MRTNLLFVQGALFNSNKYLVVSETIEYVYEKVGWAAALLNIGVIHLFGKYVVITIIVAFLKKDITAAIKKARMNMIAERERAERRYKKMFIKKDWESS